MKEGREEGPKAQVNKQKSTPKAGRKLRDIFKRVIDRIDLSEALQGMVIERTIDVLGDMAKALSRDLVAIKGTK